MTGIDSAPDGQAEAPATGLVLTRSVTRELARRGIDRAIERSRELGCRTCIAVLDSAGHLVAFERMDNAPFQSSQLAQDKAYSVAGNGWATHQFWEWIKDDPWLVHNVGQVEGLVVLGGGVPILLGDELIGTVGVSGQSDMAQDRDIAESAAAAIVAAIEGREPR
jgi:uncharacterized protein GlcG (DUF336 family)